MMSSHSEGSPGEVANDPTLGNRWWFGKEKWSNIGAYNQQELLENFRSDKASNQKQKVFNAITLFAPDQLRQRVAWALSQTFVVGEFSSAVLGDHGEVWTQYYDIFVRHAFGSYFDIMREVGCVHCTEQLLLGTGGLLCPSTHR